MRREAIFGSILTILFLIVATVTLVRNGQPIVVTRTVAKATTPIVSSTPTNVPLPSDSAEPRPSSPTPSSSHADGGAKAPVQPKVELQRAVRVSALGWEAAAPVLLANRGYKAMPQSLFSARGVNVVVKIADGLADVEKQIARGGQEEAGCDFAVVPLAAVVGGYERTRALALEVIYATAWSRGREGFLLGKHDNLFEGSADQAKMFVSGGDASTALALFVADAEGLTLSKVRQTPQLKNAEFGVQSRPFTALTSAEGPNHLVFTTVEAARWAPWVVVAPRAFVEQHPRTTALWIEGLVAGLGELARDIHVAAQTLAGIDGSVEPASLVERFGYMRYATLADNARLFETGSPFGASLRALGLRFFDLFHGVGTLGVSLPEHDWLDGSFVLTMVQKNPPEPSDERFAIVSSAEVKHAFYMRFSEKVSDEALIAEAGLLAEVFPRGRFKIGVKKGISAKKITERARDLYGIDPARFATGEVAERAAASIEVLVPR